MSRSILWFRQDLRFHDNEALIEAVRNTDELVPVYVFDITPDRISLPRLQFLIESLADLRNQFRSLGSDLLIRMGKPEEVLYSLALETRSQWVFCNRERTREEAETQDSLEKNLWTIGRELRFSRGKMLYYTSDLPFPVTHCPDSFVGFKKEVEHIIPVRFPLPVPESIPPLTKDLDSGEMPSTKDWKGLASEPYKPNFIGGETAGLSALKQSLTMPGLEILSGEGKLLSPWISMGCLSPKKVYHDSFAMKEDGEVVRQNLIYRDYLRLMGKKYGDRIFYKSGIKRIKISYRYSQADLQRWKDGNTGVAIIDAAMRQLNHAGWMPDVLRRLSANYFIKVLHLDWRLGAAYYEAKLIDYDPCSNWVTWLNLAGLGPDSREDRLINYDLAGKKLDPEGTYIKTWS